MILQVSDEAVQGSRELVHTSLDSAVLKVKGVSFLVLKPENAQPPKLQAPKTYTLSQQTPKP